MSPFSIFIVSYLAQTDRLDARRALLGSRKKQSLEVCVSEQVSPILAGLRVAENCYSEAERHSW